MMPSQKTTSFVFAVAVILAALILPGSAATDQELPPQIRADQLLFEVEKALDAGDYRLALRKCEAILALDVTVPGEFGYFYAQSLYKTERFADAKEALIAYLTEVGRKGEHYQSALETLTEVEEVIQVAAAAARKAAKGQVLIKGGCYQVGSPAGELWREDDERRHRVCVDNFYLGKHEVTRGEFAAFVRATGHQAAGDWRNPGFSQSARHPVVRVSWHDANAYTEWLSRSGLSYRLPTEAEWEYAARGDSQTAFYWGEDNAYRGICEYANVADRELKERYPDRKRPIAACNDGAFQTAPVGSYQPNAWGLYDMSGNVWEWTCSLYKSGYDGSESRCVQSPGSSKVVLRGGSWDFAPRWARSANRYWTAATGAYYSIGFRFARTP